jgi:alpha-L-fucosidase
MKTHSSLNNPTPSLGYAGKRVLVSFVSLFAIAIPRSLALGPYEGTRESISTHRVPDWFEDAKFGMFIDWGLWSVAGWAPPSEQGAIYPDWYLHRMYSDEKYKAYHNRTWGAGFTRDDFIPLFTAKKYDPDLLATIAKDSGMKYVVPFCKHCDGFCLWPSSFTDRNAMKYGPKRDLIEPLVAACRSDGLKFGFYQLLEEWEFPMLANDGRLQMRIWSAETETTTIKPYDEAYMRGKVTGKRPVRDYVKDYIVPQTMEFIERYDPDILWFDGDWTETQEAFGTYSMVAAYYNRAMGHKEVVVNDRLGKTRSDLGDFYTSEYGGAIEGKPFDLAKGRSHKWEECRGISQSFGYNRDDTEANVITATDLVQLLATVVARNGNLLLVVNLDGEGALPEIQRERLSEVGHWLSVNGEAIYCTRPWERADDGPRIFFTRNKDSTELYAICFDWPSGGTMFHGVKARPGSTITMLGSKVPLKWTQETEGLRVDVPSELSDAKPCKHAYVFKIPL